MVNMNMVNVNNNIELGDEHEHDDHDDDAGDLGEGCPHPRLHGRGPRGQHAAHPRLARLGVEGHQVESGAAATCPLFVSLYFWMSWMPVFNDVSTETELF